MSNILKKETNLKTCLQTKQCITLPQTRRYRKLLLIVVLALFFVIPEVYADDVKVFTDVHTKIAGWVTGGLGKLIVTISVVLAVIMGVAGFKWQQILIPLILGLLLGSINGIVGLFF